MKAGRELDDLVAEKVLGWEHIDLGPIDGIRWKNGDRIIESEHPFRYSTDIAAAWEILENLVGRGFEFSIQGGGDSESVVAFGRGRGAAEVVRGEAFPHAICLAALAAVGGVVAMKKRAPYGSMATLKAMERVGWMLRSQETTWPKAHARQTGALLLWGAHYLRRALEAMKKADANG